MWDFWPNKEALRWLVYKNVNAWQKFEIKFLIWSEVPCSIINITKYHSQNYFKIKFFQDLPIIADLISFRLALIDLLGNFGLKLSKTCFFKAFHSSWDNFRVRELFLQDFLCFDSSSKKSFKSWREWILAKNSKSTDFFLLFSTDCSKESFLEMSALDLFILTPRSIFALLTEFSTLVSDTGLFTLAPILSSGNFVSYEVFSSDFAKLLQRLKIFCRTLSV